MENQPSKTKISWRTFSRFIIGLVIIPSVLFLTAGTFNYWQVWLYLAVLFIPALFILAYFAKTDPAFLNRRMQFKEPEKAQKKIVRLSWIPILLEFILPGLDVRFGWSNLPPLFVIMGAVLVFTGYVIIILSFRENHYAARVVKVEEGQKVISTGPYALVRHPMYLGSMVLYLFSPLALGSYWALIPALFSIPVFIFRIRNEEEVLQRDLPGYDGYINKVHYHLIPGIW